MPSKASTATAWESLFLLSPNRHLPDFATSYAVLTTKLMQKTSAERSGNLKRKRPELSPPRPCRRGTHDLPAPLASTPDETDRLSSVKPLENARVAPL
jgi:hypothetical protein